MEEAVAFLVPMSFFALIFGIIYLHSREKMAMIERGMDPRINRPKTWLYVTLKWGSFLIGVGVGLLLSFMLEETAFKNIEGDGIVAVYFGNILIFGGLGLIASYLIEKKHLDKEK